MDPIHLIEAKTVLKYFRLISTLLGLGTLLSNIALAVETTEVFKSAEHKIVQVRVLENNSSTKSAIGSGFFVGPKGEIVTNFHVISQLVFHPDNFRIDVLTYSGVSIPAKLVRIDVVHDLAVLQTDTIPAEYFNLADTKLEKGQRLYSIGNPHDLGFTIVEGTYNGLVERSLYEKIHFTGSINPGMSGGPTLTGEGGVVGVNVSTAGNELSFLVPQKFVAELFNHANNENSDFISQVQKQLFANQDFYTGNILDSRAKPIELGNFKVLGEVNKAFHCWGVPEEKEKKKFNQVDEYCSTQDEIFLTSEVSTGSIGFSYTLLTSEELNPFQFANTVQQRVERMGNRPDDGTEEHFTNYQCKHNFVDGDKLSLHSSLCLRAYKKFPNLYDAHLFFVSLGSDTEQIGGKIKISGISFENLKRISQQFLTAIEWKHS